MDVNALLAILVAQYPKCHVALVVLGLLVLVGQTVVAMTPSQADDAAWAKIKGLSVIGLPLGALLDALIAFAPFQKK